MSDEEQPNKQSGLTPSEEQVMAHLVAAWNAWRGQPDVITTQEMERFVDGIHMAQEVLAARALYRAYPEYWTSPQMTHISGDRAFAPPVIHVSPGVDPKRVADAVLAQIDQHMRGRS